MMNDGKRLCVVTMVGGTDLIGELVFCQGGAMLERPFLLQRQGQNLGLFDMMKNGVFSGQSIELNMISCLWVAEPSEAIAKAYKAQRSGILLHGHMAANQ